jgi:hypothetical protein
VKESDVQALQDYPATTETLDSFLKGLAQSIGGITDPGQQFNPAKSTTISIAWLRLGLISPNIVI